MPQASDLGGSSTANMFSPTPSYQNSSLNFLPLFYLFTWIPKRTGAQRRVISLSQCAWLWMGSCWDQYNHLLDQHWEQRRLHLLSQTKVNKVGFLASIADILESWKEGHKNSQTRLPILNRKWWGGAWIWKTCAPTLLTQSWQNWMLPHCNSCSPPSALGNQSISQNDCVSSVGKGFKVKSLYEVPHSRFNITSVLLWISCCSARLNVVTMSRGN